MARRTSKLILYHSLSYRSYHFNFIIIISTLLYNVKDIFLCPFFDYYSCPNCTRDPCPFIFSLITLFLIFSLIEILATPQLLVFSNFNVKILEETCILLKMPCTDKIMNIALYLLQTLFFPSIFSIHREFHILLKYISNSGNRTKIVLKVMKLLRLFSLYSINQQNQILTTCEEFDYFVQFLTSYCSLNWMSFKSFKDIKGWN
ncbi:hypothetical protein L9F63_011846, partial [Diploptera punctata]